MPRITGIRIEDVDTSMSSRGGRVLTVKVGSHSFQTPTRPFSVMEIGAKSFLGYRGTIQSDVAMLPVDFLGKRKEYFLKNNGVLHKTEQKLQSHVDSSISVPSIPVIQMDPLPVGDRGSLKIAYEMQKAIDGLLVLSMPEVSAGKEEFERCLKDWCDSAEDDGFGVAVHLSLKDDIDIFADKLDVVSEYSRTGCITAVNMRYVSPDGCRQQMARLWEKREALESIVNCSGMTGSGPEVARGLRDDLESSILQSGFDMITRKKTTPSQKYIAYLQMNRQFDSIDDFRIQRHDASASIAGDCWLSMTHPLECKCSVCRGDGPDRLRDRFNYLDNGEVSKSGMRYFSILHDHQSDIDELGVFRKYTSNGETREYNERLESNRAELINRVGPYRLHSRLVQRSVDTMFVALRPPSIHCFQSSGSL